MNQLTDKQLSAQLSSWKRKLAKEKPQFFAIKTDQNYAGPEKIQVDDECFAVRTCRSDLEARDILNQASKNGEKSVLLFKINHNKVGSDLINRLAGRRLQSLDPTNALKELFKAKTIDPRISNHKSMVEALVQKATQQNVPSSSVGFLDADLAWSVLLDQPEIAGSRPDIVQLLKYSLDGDTWSAISDLEPEVATLFFDWIEERNGPAVRFIRETAISQGTPAELLVPIGLCAAPLFCYEGDGDAEVRIKAQGRLESYVGDYTLDPTSAQAWSKAAIAAAKTLDDSKQRALCDKVDNLLRALKAESVANEIEFSKLGMRQRFDQFAEALESFMRRKEFNGLQDLTASFNKLLDNHLSSQPDYKSRIEQCRMACRLGTWVKQSESNTLSTHSLRGSMDRYFQNSSFVDRAIAQLADNDQQDGLDRAYRKIRNEVSNKRFEEQSEYAEVLRNWNLEPESEPVLRVEDVVQKVVAPLAKTDKVLMLVLDGMSCSVFSELLKDLEDRDWRPITRSDVSNTVLSAIPSVTAISRKALFSGKLDSSDRRTEQVAFREHPSLAATTSKAKPKLFLKGDLSEEGETSLSPTLRDELNGDAMQVVGVLLNVIDDQLSGSDQLNIEWRVSTIRFLGQILEAATEGQRKIVLVSDHGNVLEFNQTKKLSVKSSDGDRYRADGELLDPENEIKVSGPRIEAATGSESLIAASTNRIRYSNKKAGYHGGVSDMETVIPMAILQKEDDPPMGWEFIDLHAPSWWDWENSETPEDKPAKKPAPKKTKKRSVPVAEKETLELDFELPAPKKSESWIDDLLQGSVYQDQLSLIGKTPLKESHIRGFLEAMDHRQGSTPFTILAADMKQPARRLRGLISHLKRLFNLDGYEIVSEETSSETVRFDKSLALKQFDVADSQ